MWINHVIIIYIYIYIYIYYNRNVFRGECRSIIERKINLLPFAATLILIKFQRSCSPKYLSCAPLLFNKVVHNFCQFALAFILGKYSRGFPIMPHVYIVKGDSWAPRDMTIIIYRYKTYFFFSIRRPTPRNPESTTSIFSVPLISFRKLFEFLLCYWKHFCCLQ